MKTAVVRGSRNRVARVAVWIAEDKPGEITKAGKVFAHLVLPASIKAPKLVRPDILAQLNSLAERKPLPPEVACAAA